MTTPTIFIHCTTDDCAVVLQLQHIVAFGVAYGAIAAQSLADPDKPYWVTNAPERLEGESDAEWLQRFLDDLNEKTCDLAGVA